MKTIGCALSTAPFVTGALESPKPRATGNRGWTADWDRALLEGVLSHWDRVYDPGASLLTAHRGPEYNYHSGLRDAVVHPTRESFEYALLLLEVGHDERRDRALKVLDRNLDLQESDSKSQWYGLWSYYLEEPLTRMPVVDMNWADFNGALLLVTLYRHEKRLPAEYLRRIREAVRRAAFAIRRRNVTPYYTNIAVQGAFVTLGAAEVLADADLLSYGQERLRRIAATVDESGSFAEYNSPTYMHVTLENLTRILSFVRSLPARTIADRLHQRLWLHISSHWHVPTGQLAGPMSRAYSNDVGSPLWLQKSLNNELTFLSMEEIQSRPPGGSGGVAVLAYGCPEPLSEHASIARSLSAARSWWTT